MSLLQSGNRAFATADDDDSDDEPAPAPAKASAVRPSQAAAAGRGGGRGGAGGVGGKGPKDSATRQAEHRLKKLAEEAEVRHGHGTQDRVLSVCNVRVSKDTSIHQCCIACIHTYILLVSVLDVGCRQQTACFSEHASCAIS